MKDIKNYLNESVNGAEFQLVETRNGFGFLFGTLKNPMSERDVKALAKKIKVNCQSISDVFDADDLEYASPGAIYEVGEDEIIWYDLNDGTVDLVK